MVLNDVSDTGAEIRVSIRNRKEVLFEGPAFSVTSFNAVGEFDVLPGHAHFISLIKDSVVVDKDLPHAQEFEIDAGLISVDERGVSIYVGIGSDRSGERKA